MIIIDSVLVSDEIVEEQFVCDLTKCKGGCCEDGDAGAPLENKEKDFINEYYDIVAPYMTIISFSIMNCTTCYIVFI